MRRQQGGLARSSKQHAYAPLLMAVITLSQSAMGASRCYKPTAVIALLCGLLFRRCCTSACVPASHIFCSYPLQACNTALLVMQHVRQTYNTRPVCNGCMLQDTMPA
jgi:hypothetical protein